MQGHKEVTGCGLSSNKPIIKDCSQQICCFLYNQTDRVQVDTTMILNWPLGGAWPFSLTMLSIFRQG